MDDKNRNKICKLNIYQQKQNNTYISVDGTVMTRISSATASMQTLPYLTLPSCC